MQYWYIKSTVITFLCADKCTGNLVGGDPVSSSNDVGSISPSPQEAVNEFAVDIDEHKKKKKVHYNYFKISCIDLFRTLSLEIQEAKEEILIT